MAETILKIALVGRPNVGKSTLFNRLTRSKDALVDPTPGLTRDVRKRQIEIDKRQILVFDTGGLAAPEDSDPIAGLVHRHSMRAIKDADRILLLVDAQEGLTQADREVAKLLRREHLYFHVVANKVESKKIQLGLYEFYELGVNEVLEISAVQGKGLRELRQLIVKWADEKKKSLDEKSWVQLDKASLTLEGNITEDETEQVEAPIRVSIIGRPNIGKSSLLNRLAGEPRMIVTDIPGTTRDAIDTLIERQDGPDILVTDTAGIRRRAKVKDKIEKFSILKAIEAIRTCHVAMVMLDATEGVTDQDKKLIGYVDEYNRSCITLYNKWDLIQGDKKTIGLRLDQLRMAKRFVPYSPHLNISALTGKGVRRIFHLIEEVYGHFSTKVNTGRINQVLQKAMAQRTPPIHKGHHLRLYYATQLRTRPPTFLIFANYPEYIPNQYKRFIVNQIRQQLNIPYTPIRLVFRERERR